MRIRCEYVYIEKYNKEKPVTYINDIPFVFLAKRGRAGNLRIGLSKQLCFIPIQYVNGDGFIHGNINWWFNDKNLQHKIELYKEEISNGKNTL